MWLDEPCATCGHDLSEHDNCYDLEAEPCCYHEDCECEWFVFKSSKGRSETPPIALILSRCLPCCGPWPLIRYMTTVASYTERRPMRPWDRPSSR
jgi:hypothetical protein